MQLTVVCSKTGINKSVIRVDASRRAVDSVESGRTGSAAFSSGTPARAAAITYRRRTKEAFSTRYSTPIPFGQNTEAVLGDIRARKIDFVVVYEVDRHTRSLADFAKLVELFEAHGVSFVAVTQQFNTTTSMGRLTLNVLLSFAHSSASWRASASATNSRPHAEGYVDGRQHPARL